MLNVIRDAIENARNVGVERKMNYKGQYPDRRMPFERMTAILKSIVRDLPDDMTVGQIREELGE